LPAVAEGLTPFGFRGRANLNTGAANLNGIFPTSKLSGTINVTDTPTWTGGSANVTDTFNIKNMSLAPNSARSVNANWVNPAVGTVFEVLNFANSYFGDFADLNIPVIGTNDYLKETLTSSGLSFAVTPNPSK
jgi:hypothetical protein